tara:strand:+ start:129518 stop:130537 length:1020 start_codon:yes stop_codon:yes gene_type:complete
MTETNAQGPQHFSEIHADRACIGCGFNLYAQPVSKEEHYGLAICKCPECGTVAALQSYPVMSHWVNRFRTLIAAIWIIALLGIFIAYTMSITGMAQGTANLAGEKLGDIIGHEHHIWSQEQDRLRELAKQTGQAAVQPALPVPAPDPLSFGGTTTIVTSNGVTTVNGTIVPTTPLSPTQSGQYNWVWLSQGWGDAYLQQVIDDSGGLLENIDRQFLVMLIPGTIVGTLFGIFWSVALLGGTRRKALIVPLVACLIACMVLIGMSRPDYNYTYISGLTQDLYAPVIGPVFIGYMFLISCFGIWIGRMVARRIVVMALPARSRIPLSNLWIQDGLALPKPN